MNLILLIKFLEQPNKLQQNLIFIDNSQTQENLSEQLLPLLEKHHTMTFSEFSSEILILFIIIRTNQVFFLF